MRRATRAVERRLPLTWQLRLRFYRRHRYPLSLAHPATYNEKLHWRMAHDRRELLAGTCDKLRMKEIARAAAVPGLRVPETLWSGTDLAELAEVDLPERWVLKPNHRFGLVELGSGRPDVAALRALTEGWLDEAQAGLGEWAYSRASRTLLVEEMIGTTPPDDYKFMVFHGEPRIVAVHTDRFTGHRDRWYYPDWEPAGGTVARPMAELAPPPELLEPMLEAAAALGRPFDFIRVDLYQVDGEVWFGELTPYPGSGMLRLQPPGLDAELGGHWHLPAVT